MAGVLPKGDRMRKAVRWISDESLQDETKDLVCLINDACSRFNLSPLEEEFLHSFYAECDDGQD